MLLFCLFLILAVLLYLEYRLFEKSCLAPAVLFTAGFSICALGACLYQSQWGYSMSPELFFLLITLIVLFGLACFVLSRCSHAGAPVSLDEGRLLPVKNGMLYAFAVFQVIVFLWSIIELRMMYPGHSLVDAIGQYNVAAKFALTQYGSVSGSYVSWSFPVGPLRTVCDACAHITLFLLAQEIALRSRSKIRPVVINCILAFCLSLETGSRGVAVGYVIFAIACYVVLRARILGKWPSITARQFGLAIVVAIAFFASFRLMAIGREGDFSVFEYLSIYLGGQLPSLDLFLDSSSLPTSAFFGEQTFRSSLEYAGKYLGIDAWMAIPYTLDFQEMGGHLLGNVYTTFYPFLQDGGIIGAALFTVVMALVAQFVYQKAISSTSHCFDLTIVVYAFMVSPLLLSFFSDRFYSDILSIPFLRTLVIIFVARWVYLNFGNNGRNVQQDDVWTGIDGGGENSQLASSEGIGVVVVAFNRVDCLKKALEAFEIQTVAPAYILVVDNASTDGTGAFLEGWVGDSNSVCQRYVIHERENKGGSGGFHDGLKEAAKLNSEWIWLSDDDAYPEPNCIEIASKWIFGHDTSDISAICGAVVNCGHIDTGHRRNIEVKNMRVRENQVPEEMYGEDFEVNALSFVGAIVKKGAVEHVGLPLEDYFIWYDDTEYSLRLSEVGRVVCVPSIRVNHDASKSDDYLTWKGYYGQRNLLDMIMRHYPRHVYLYSRIRAYLKAAKLRKISLEVSDMYRAAIRDQRLGIAGISDTYRPGWKTKGTLAHG